MTTSTAGEAPVPTFRRELHPSPVSVSRRDEIHAAPGFGRYFTDHMVLIDYDDGVGWHDPRVVPYGPFSLDPATMVLHYGQEIFEGLTSRRQVPSPHRAARARRIVRVLVLAFSGLVVVDSVVGERGLLAMLRARHEQQQLAGRIARVRAENERLREETRRLHDDPYAIEEIARREMGLIRPGEKIFIIKDLPPHSAP
jgi:cell division protein FtsB